MRIFFFIGFVLLSLTIGQTVDLQGRVISTDSLPITGAEVRLVGAGLLDTTDSDGGYHLLGIQTAVRQKSPARNPLIAISRGTITVVHSWPIDNASLAAYSLQGRLLFTAPISKKAGNRCVFNVRQRMNQVNASNEMRLIRLTVNGTATYGIMTGFEGWRYGGIAFPKNTGYSDCWKKFAGPASADTMIIKKSGHVTRRMGIRNLRDTVEPIVLGRQFTVIDSNLVDAEYSPALDLVVCVCSTPNRIILFEPETGEKSVFALNKPPTCVSVGIDGGYAAVGHDAMISYIDLRERCLKDEYDVSTLPHDIILGGNEHVYSFPELSQHTKIYCTNLTTRQERLGGSIYEDTKAKMHPSSRYMYCARNHITNSAIERFDILADSTSNGYKTKDGTYDYNGNVWISEDGSRLFSEQGYVFATDSLPSLDMKAIGKLNCDYIMWLTYSRRFNLVALLSLLDKYKISFYDQMDSIPIETVSLSTMVQSPSWNSAVGKFVFFGQDGRTCTVLLTGNGYLFSAYTMNDDQYPKQ